MNRLSDSQLDFLRSEPLTGPNKLKLALRLLNMTQVEFADVLGMHVVVLNRIIGGSNITLATARRLADALGAGLDDLFPSPSINRRAKKDRRTRTGISAPAREQRSGKDRRGPKAELPGEVAA